MGGRPNGWSMFLRYFVELALPFETVDAELLGLPEEWIPGVARDANDRGERLLAEVGFGPQNRRVEKQVRIELGEAVRLSSKTVLPMSWRATGLQPLFPVLEADIEVAALGPNRTQLSINARYEPPFRALGRAIDRALMHRVAEATVKDFLDRVAQGLQARVSTRTE